jgi:transcription elongation GreA/GreB family factor
VKKSVLIKKITSSLVESLELLQKAARASHAEATHESSKAENKYDTRGLEAAYLAGGQARQVREIMEAIEQYEVLPNREFESADGIDVSALVELETDGTRGWYFIGPKCGGLEVKVGGKEVLVITPQSPLGKNLIGRKSGEQWSSKLSGSMVQTRILSVQ